MAKQFFNAGDAPSMKMAEFFCNIDGRRIQMFNAKNFEATASVSTTNIPRLGAVIAGKKATALEIKLTFTIYKCTEAFDGLIERFKNTAQLPKFECQVTSEDEGTSIGRSTKVYRNCSIDGDVLLSAFDADGEIIEQQITAYADDFESVESYSEPAYM